MRWWWLTIAMFCGVAIVGETRLLQPKSSCDEELSALRLDLHQARSQIHNLTRVKNALDLALKNVKGKVNEWSKNINGASIEEIQSFLEEINDISVNGLNSVNNISKNGNKNDAMDSDNAPTPVTEPIEQAPSPSEDTTMTVVTYPPKPIESDVAQGNIQSNAIANMKNNLVILVGLPKSGTSSVHEAIVSLHIKSAHFAVDGHHAVLCDGKYPIKEVKVKGVTETTWNQIDNCGGCYAGVQVQRAISDKKKPLQYLYDVGYRAFSQIDVCLPQCHVSIWPQIDAIETIVNAYPNAYYVHTRRVTPFAHAASFDAWNTFLPRLNESGLLNRFPGQRTNNSNFDNVIKLIEFHNKFVVDFFKKRPKVKFIDVTIEDSETGEMLRNFFGLESFPLKHANSGHYDRTHTAAPTPSP